MNFAQKTYKNRAKYTGLIFFLLIFVSDDTVLFGTNANGVFIGIKYATIISLFVYFFVKSITRKPLSSKNILIAICMSLLVLLSGFSNNDWITGYFYKILLIWFGLSITSVTRIDVFLKYFVDTIYFLTIYSILCQLLYLIIPGAISVFPLITNSADVSFHNLGLAVIPIEGTLRLYGPFREPGVFQIFLNIAILITLAKPKIDRLKFVILSLGLILTQSTTGYIAFFIILCSLISGHPEDKSFLLFSTIIGVAALIFFTDLLSFQGQVFDKIQDQSRHTTIARMASVFCNIELIKEYPIFGCGLSKLEDLFPVLSFRKYGFASPHNTNVMLIQYAAHGIVYGLIWTLFVGKFFISFSESFFVKSLLFIAFCVICEGENLSWSVFYYILLFYGANLPARNSKGSSQRRSNTIGIPLS